MKLFSHANRPFHLSRYPMERMARSETCYGLDRVKDTGQLEIPPEQGSMASAIGEFMCALDGIREGVVNEQGSEVPHSLEERSRHLKSVGYFLDSSLVGICPLSDNLHLEPAFEHAQLQEKIYPAAIEKLRLRFNPQVIIRQIAESRTLSRRPLPQSGTVIVIAVEHPRDPSADEPGTQWICGLQDWRGAVRANETAGVIACYLRLLGFAARSHSATTSDIHLYKAAAQAGIGYVSADGDVINPYFGQRYSLAAVTTSLQVAADLPLGKGSDRQGKGLGWYTGASAPKHAGNQLDFRRRRYRDSRYPTEKLKRVPKTTNFIDEDRVPRSPKSSEFFLRAAFGDLGEKALDVSKDGYSVGKAPLGAALRQVLNVYSLLQRGEPADNNLPRNYADTQANADMLKATMHFLGADLAGVSAAPDWVWYSHRQDGTEMPVAHPFAVSVMIDQGYETMDGASGDDWISSAQSMRTYMRASLLCGILGLHLRNLGFNATAHSAADSDVVQTPLVLLAGLGEVSRIGETILNPFLGPRLKTGILTTNFPITPDLPIDFGLQNFCNSCNKCARECPSGAISAGPKVMFNGYEIWKADVEKCTRYRTTNMGGAMCGRCMKTCPWNLAGLVHEAPFRWAAQHVPWAAAWLARMDDWLNRGSINPVKKWWWDLVNDGTGRFVAAEHVNARDLSKHIDLKHDDQTLACYPIEIVPAPLPKPNPVDREAGIKAYQNLLSPREYRSRLQRGSVDGLVGTLKTVGNEPDVIIGKVQRRKTSSADGKIDLFEIVAQDGRPLPVFEAGAHIDAYVTPQYIRQFSLAGNPKENGSYLIGVLREDEGRGGSVKFHQMALENAPVIVSRPRNHFPIVKSAKRHLLFAGGIGVTPLIAMGHVLHAQQADFVLYYKARTRSQAAFIEELNAVAWVDQIRFHFSDEDRLDVSTVLGDYRKGDHLYCCGPAAFMDALFESAGSQGWPEDVLHREYFSVPSGAAYVNHPFKLVLQNSGTQVEVSAEENAIEALARIGISVDNKCQDGLCGVCEHRYVGGEVEHRDYVLSGEARNSKVILCCSRAAEPNGVVTLDL